MIATKGFIYDRSFYLNFLRLYSWFFVFIRVLVFISLFLVFYFFCFLLFFFFRFLFFFNFFVFFFNLFIGFVFILRHLFDKVRQSVWTFLLFTLINIFQSSSVSLSMSHPPSTSPTLQKSIQPS